MSNEHCVRMVLKVEDSPSSTRLSKWVIFSVSVSSRVCSRVLLSISAKHLCKKKRKCVCTDVKVFCYDRYKQKSRTLTTEILTFTRYLNALNASRFKQHSYHVITGTAVASKVNTPVHELKHKVFKLSWGWAQLSLQLKVVQKICKCSMQKIWTMMRERK